MPECKMGLNDIFSLTRKDRAEQAQKLEDINFHQCVKLSKYDQDKAITFTPPDKKFDLLTYRISEYQAPFKLILVTSY